MPDKRYQIKRQKEKGLLPQAVCGLEDLFDYSFGFCFAFFLDCRSDITGLKTRVCAGTVQDIHEFFAGNGFLLIQVLSQFVQLVLVFVQ